MRAFAILPAAGKSQRMGCPKLLLPWDRETTVIEHVLRVWQQSQVTSLVIIVSPGDNRLAVLCQKSGAQLVQASVQPPDMKSSVRLGLDYLERQLRPSCEDVWLLAPADMPLLQTSTIDRLILAAKQLPPNERRERVVVPCHAGRRGHPVLMPWSTKAAVDALNDQQGIDQIVRQLRTLAIDVDDPGSIADLDTPDDYQRLKQSNPSQSATGT